MLLDQVRTLKKIKKIEHLKFLKVEVDHEILVYKHSYEFLGEFW